MSPRSQKLASLLHVHLGTLMLQHTSPNQVGFLTITAVEVSGDLGVADVYVSFLKSPADALLQLQKKSKLLAHELLHMLNLKRTIQLRFKQDNSIEKTQKLFGNNA